MRRRLRLALLGLGLAMAAVLALDRVLPPDLSRYRLLSRAMVDEAGRALNFALASDGMWRLPTSPERVSPNYLAALLAAEDHRFYVHPGIDPLAVGRAVWQLATHGHVVSGASTLTMQVARLLTSHRHDLAGKLADMVRALQLEAHYSKRDILAMYLTLAPFGGNIEGVRAASLVYFEHEPDRLSDAEAGLLVALPQSPTRLRPDRHPAAAVAAGRRLAARLASPALEAATAPQRHPLPSLAPHLAVRLAAAGATGEIRTTLAAPLQGAVEGLLRREQPWLGDDADIAVLVVRNADRAVLAYVGGVDYLAPQGMVDMVQARRSPGSALKPFIYGLAFDEALALPETIIEDARLRLGDYAPQNFDRSFHGRVTIREALQQSYNLPAVMLLAELGPGRFAAALRQAGARLALPNERNAAPGLPIALGGLGISLQDLAALYAALADGGRAAGLRLLADEPVSGGVPLMTARAAADVGDILRGLAPPDGIAPRPGAAIAYKTGTSYGFRDAWAAGYSERVTVAVWVGRVEGSPRPGAFGRNTAAPLLFKIFDLLPEPSGSRAPAPVRHESGTLAPALRNFAPRGGGGGLRILFPPEGATLEAGGATPIALEAAGGVPPYRWAVNGVPLPPLPRGSIPSWQPDGAGFTRISVIDQANASVSAEIRVAN
jgi:penicillin-binding protein 1C